MKCLLYNMNYHKISLPLSLRVNSLCSNLLNRKHEVLEIVQNLNSEQNHQSNSVESFLVNCLSMVVFSIGTMNLALVNK